jgi:hypothetical protein
MKRSQIVVLSILATLLLAIPVRSQACFGFFGGGFGFGFGGDWGGWGGPGWWGPGYWGGYPGYWGGPGYWQPPYAWHRLSAWGYPGYGLGMPYVYAPPSATPAPKAPAAPSAK